MPVTSGNLSNGSDTIFAGESLSGNQTIISKGGVFELGFFTPGNSHNYYIGICGLGGNRNQPVSDPSSSALQLFQDGNLVLLTSNKIRVWSTNSTSGLPNSTQSFDHPTDTWLPGAKFGYNKVTNDSQILTSWRSYENPAPGLFSAELEPKGTSYSLKWNRSNLYWTNLNRYVKNLTFVSSENESYFICSAASDFALTRSVLDVTGQLTLSVWWKELQQWNLVWIKPKNQCEVYATCGVFSSCNEQNSTVCACIRVVNVLGPIRIQGFEPSKSNEWNLKDQSGGCVRRAPLQCDHSGNDAFLLIPNMLFPVNSVALRVNNIEECKSTCLSNCSCTAYAYDNGCFIWIGELVNLKQLSSENKIGREIHVRVAASELLGSKELLTKNCGFGSVFKGTLPNSTAIAVKKLRSVKQDEKQFRFCAEASKWFIVYDYMPKGSLESHLFRKGSQILDWKIRYNIALGTARGLVYLHEECRDCIIHCEIKPENILLDADYNPKVADFGLAKLVGRDFSWVLTTIRGTRGYLAPEWLSGEVITPKVDVFSFGKLLFEIISGRRNTDVPNDDLSNYYPTSVANAINKGEEVMMLLDYKLENSDSIEELTRACKVACWCIQDDEKDRPTMGPGMPPIPRILQRLAEDPMISNFYQEIETSTSSY
ncbi:hypothetical protein ACB098_06G124700 [Castanea mollissima]